MAGKSLRKSYYLRIGFFFSFIIIANCNRIYSHIRRINTILANPTTHLPKLRATHLPHIYTYTLPICLPTRQQYVPSTYQPTHPIPSHPIPSHPIPLHCIALHYITLHYITLHYITLHYITLHYSMCHPHTSPPTSHITRNPLAEAALCSPATLGHAPRPPPLHFVLTDPWPQLAWQSPLAASLARPAPARRHEELAYIVVD